MSEFVEQSYAPPKKPSATENVDAHYEDLDLYSLVGGKKEQILSLEDKIQQGLAKERQKLTEQGQQLEARIDETVKVGESLVTALEQTKSWWNQAKNEMTEMVLLLAERVVDQELLHNPDIIKKCIVGVLDQSDDEEKKSLVLNPEDLNFLKKERSEFATKLEANRSVEIVLDRDIQRGSARLDTTSLSVETSIYKRFEYLWNELTQHSVEEAQTDEPAIDVPEIEGEDE